MRQLADFLRELVGQQPIPEYLPRRLFPKHLVLLPVEDLGGGFTSSSDLVRTLELEIERHLGEFFYGVHALDELEPGRKFHKKGVRTPRQARKVKVYPSQAFYDLGRVHGRRVLGVHGKGNVVALVLTKRRLYSRKVELFEATSPVFGEANRLLDVCVVSLKALREGLPADPERARLLFHQRVVKEALHELGHLVIHSIKHCSNPKCVMSWARDVDEVDSRQVGFCPACRDILTRMREKFNI
ncbi:MAG: hypothetical protein Kow0069_21850 [Promethearchaeota archaeon]